MLVVLIKMGDVFFFPSLSEHGEGEEDDNDDEEEEEGYEWEENLAVCDLVLFLSFLFIFLLHYLLFQIKS